jgi:hypothetical protein
MSLSGKKMAAYGRQPWQKRLAQKQQNTKNSSNSHVNLSSYLQ